MKVFVKHTVFDRILVRIESIRRDFREPDYVVVSAKEYDELRSDRRAYSSIDYGVSYRVAAEDTASFETKDFIRVTRPRPGSIGYGEDVYRAFAREKIFGIPLYVVPESFCPSE